MVIKKLVQIIIAIKKVQVLNLNVPQYHNEYRYELIKHQKLNFLLFLSSSHHSHKKKIFFILHMKGHEALRFHFTSPFLPPSPHPHTPYYLQE